MTLLAASTVEAPALLATGINTSIVPHSNPPSQCLNNHSHCQQPTDLLPFPPLPADQEIVAFATSRIVVLIGCNLQGQKESAVERKVIASTAFSSFTFCGLLLLLFRFFIAQHHLKEPDAATLPSPNRYCLQKLRSASMRRSMFMNDDRLDTEHWREFSGKVCVHCNRGRYAAGDRVEGGEIEDGGADDEVDLPARTGRRDQEKSSFPAGLVSSSSPFSKTQSLISPRLAKGNHQLPLPPNEPLPSLPDRLLSTVTVLPPRPSVESNHQLPLPPNEPLPRHPDRFISTVALLPSRPPGAPSPPQPKPKPNLEASPAAPPPETNSLATAVLPPQPLLSPKP